MVLKASSKELYWKSKIGIFVTGTGTDIGKTVVSAWIMLQLSRLYGQACYWKPVQSGTHDVAGKPVPLDRDEVRRLTGFPPNRFLPSVYELKAPLSPHKAAWLEDVQIDMAQLVPPQCSGPMVVEGAGGVLVPMNQNALMVDLMAQLGFPVVLVCGTALGTINASLLSLEALRARNIKVAGVVMSGVPNVDNRDAIESYGQVDILADVPQLAALNAETLGQVPAPKHFDIMCANLNSPN